MSYIGNALLGLAALILYYLVTSFYSKPIPGGDAGMGYALGIFVLNLALVICMGIAALIIGSKGGFEWVSATKSTRSLYTTVSIIAILIFTALAGLLEGESKNFGGPARFILPIFYLVWDAERVIRAIDKFQSKEIDYLPAMKELRASMDEPSGHDKPKFIAATMLDNWIKAHG